MVTAGEVLRKKRESLGKNLDTVSQDTKVQKRFLEYIEKNEYDRFESEIFLTGFLKIYSQYLNLDTEKILALYRRDKPQIKTKTSRKELKEKNLKKNKLSVSKIFTPKILITTLITIFLVGILGYIGLQIYKFQSPPGLEITEPTDGYTTENEKITVKGKTNPDAVLEINEKMVEITEDGTFETSITLNEGMNIISVKARKNSNNILETVETRKITYNKPQEVVVEEPEVIINKVKLEVIESASWVRLDVDDINKISQVVQPSTQEYEVNTSFYAITGRVTNTKIYFNDQIIEWGTSNSSGVAEITCTIEENTLKCE